MIFFFFFLDWMSYYFYIPKFIGLSFLGHLWIHLEQRGLEIWTFSVRLKTVMLHFRFPFTTSTTFCVTSFLGITAIWFGTTHQRVDWHDRHGFYSILTTNFHGNGLYSWDDHCWETLELLCWIWRFGYTIFCLSLGLNFLIIDPLSKNFLLSYENTTSIFQAVWVHLCPLFLRETLKWNVCRTHFTPWWY